MLGAQVNENSRLADLELSKLAEDYEPEWPYLVGAISRGDETHIPRREAVIMAGDIVRAVCLADRVPEFMADLGLEDTRHRRILIIGGGRTGESLATRLAEKGLLVRLVEKKGRARRATPQVAAERSHAAPRRCDRDGLLGHPPDGSL